MSTAPLTVALLGLPEPERLTVLAGLRTHAGLGGRAYEQVLDVDDARLVLADADHPGTLALLEALGRVADTLFIGQGAPPGAAGWLARPVSTVGLLRLLDQLAEPAGAGTEAPVAATAPAARPAAPAAPAAPSARPAGPVPVFPSLTAATAAPMRLTLPRELDSDFLPFDALPDSASVPAPGRLSAVTWPDASRPGPAFATAATPTPAPRATRRPATERVVRPLVAARALLVDDSAVALHFLKRLLQPYRLTIDTAGNLADALVLLATEVYGLVFLDVDLGGEGGRHGGLTLCHRVRHLCHHPGGRPPTVVMVSAFHDPVDRVRGTLAGAEAFLGKPLDVQALDQLMRRLGFGAGAGAEAVAPGASLNPAAPRPAGPRR